MKTVPYSVALAKFHKFIKASYRTQQEATVAFGYKPDSSVISNTLHGHRLMTPKMLGAIGMEWSKVVVKK